VTQEVFMERLAWPNDWYHHLTSGSGLLVKHNSFDIRKICVAILSTESQFEKFVVVLVGLIWFDSDVFHPFTAR
jgi:hypothetical protein